ncbi:Trypsin-like peptidase domain-containing protein [Oscillibacter sp. PC13]|uniref:S1C family serine protease n=1 Tax=Oscillibacter sp. PC13 TaxID=1855299 RepID=UPI0008EA77DA|nr:trypsin-like peptidase domain-containing protein [Oscillibacter sp. PC13]SFP60143.1 Trypsin-like peptidase domain-containing protein [Oscillibacter sp. PC13]
MKKRLFAFLCVLTLLASTAPFSSALEGEALRAADTLHTLGLVNGTAPGSYALEEPATRAQAVVLLVRLAGGEATSSHGIPGFRDVPAWAASAVGYASQKNWVNGVTQMDFKPDQVITANAWCTFLLRMLGYSDKDGDFTVDGAPAFAQRIGLVSDLYSGTLTRGDLFETAAGALSFSYRDGSSTVIGHLVETGAVSRAAANALGLLNTELSARQAAERHLSAVFCLQAYETQEDVDKKTHTSDASGFFISADGLAVTNYHSIEDSVYATATLSTGETYPVERVLFYDEEIDIAVLRISKTSTDRIPTSAFAYLELVGTNDLRAGDTVYALGNPLGLGLAVSSGIVSDPARTVERYELPCVMSTADISRGSSGGALLNTFGQVVAVTSGAYTYGNSMYLAVPVNPVMEADLTAAGWTLADLASGTAT